MKGGGKKTLCFFLSVASLMVFTESVEAVTPDIIQKMNSADGSTSVQFQDSNNKNLSMIDSKGNAVIFGSATVSNGGLTTMAVVSTGPINLLPSGINAAQVNSNGIVAYSSVSVNTLGGGGLASLYSDSNGVMASTSTVRFPNLFSSYIPVRNIQQACFSGCSVTVGFSDVDVVPNAISPSGNLSVRVLERFSNIATNNWPDIKLYDGTQGAIVVNMGYQNPNTGNFDSGWTAYNATSVGSQHDWYVIVSFDASGTVTVNELVVLVRPAQ